MKHLWDKGQMWPLFTTTAAYDMNTFASEVLSGLSPFQLVFLRDPPNLTSLSFPKIDSVVVGKPKYMLQILHLNPRFFQKIVFFPCKKHFVNKINFPLPVETKFITISL